MVEQNMIVLIRELGNFCEAIEGFFIGFSGGFIMLITGFFIISLVSLMFWYIIKTMDVLVLQ